MPLIKEEKIVVASGSSTQENMAAEPSLKNVSVLSAVREKTQQQQQQQQESSMWSSSDSSPSELCDLTTKLEGESLIKVDSMLSQPCRYLVEVPLFEDEAAGVAEGGEVQQATTLSQNKVDLTESLPVLEAGGITAPNLTEPAEEDVGTVPAGAEGGSDGDIQQGGVSKDTKMDLINSGPFLVSEEGAIFQCIPISEKEVIIVSLDENSLIVNETLNTTNQAGNASSVQNPLASTVPEGRINEEKNLPENTPAPSVTIAEALDPCGSKEEEEAGLNVPSSSQTCAAEPVPTVQATDAHNIPAVQDTSPSPAPNLPTDVSDDTVENTTESSVKKKAVVENSKEQELQVTIYVSGNKRGRAGSAGELEEQPSAEWVKCSVCHDTLPSPATLRHHLVTTHHMRNLTSYLCFLCKQECWSESQQEWHLRVQHGIKNKALACPVCGAQLATRAECKAHIRKHPSTHSCPKCLAKFPAQHQLVSHVKEHLRELQPHHCLVCDQRFKHPATLQTHARRHQPQLCPCEGCHHLTQDYSWLVVHLHNHGLSNKEIQAMCAAQDAYDRKIDNLLTIYTSVSKKHVTSEPRFYKLEDFLAVDSIKFSKNEKLCTDSSNVGNFSSKSVKQCEDANICCSIVNSLVEAVAEAEEEEEQEEVREEDMLVRVTVEEQTQHRCGLCNVYLPSQEELAAHKASHNQTIVCVKCQKSFHSVKQLLCHVSAHNSRDPDQPAERTKAAYEYRCLVCEKTFGSKSALSKHASTHARSQGRHQCKTCKRRVRTRASLIEHMARVHKVHHESKKLPCPMCDRRFISKAHLELHLATHGERPQHRLTCTTCGRHFLRPRSLQRHLATHQQEFVCPTCGLSLPSSSRLKLHAKTHDPEHVKELGCPECPLRFDYPSQVKVHMRTHTGERPYVCELCGKCFKRLQQVKAHHAMLHSESKKPCPECGNTFNSDSNLHRHLLLVHYHLKRWICGVCAQSYSYSQDLRNHLGKQHNLPFAKVEGRSKKKGRTEVYVVPELGTHDISPLMQQSIENMCNMVNQKVQQIISSTYYSFTKLKTANTKAAEVLEKNPDEPEAPEEVHLPGSGLPAVMNKTSVAVQENPVALAPLLAPSGTLALPAAIPEDSQVIALDKPLPGLIRIAGGVCVECGVVVTASATAVPLRCGPCGALVCSQPHLNHHITTNHRLMFQCSVCGLHYGSQAECVAHVSAAHSVQFMAVQSGAAGTILTQPPPAPPPPLQISGSVGTNLAPQFTAVPQQASYIQVAAPSQPPLIVAQGAPNPMFQQATTGSFIIQGSTSVVPTVNLCHQEHTPSMEVPVQQQVEPEIAPAVRNQKHIARRQRKASHTILRDNPPEPSSSSITASTPSNKERVLLPKEGAAPVVTTSLPTTSTIAVNAPQPPLTTIGMDTSSSTFVLGNNSVREQTTGSTGSMLLVGSLPLSNMPVHPTSAAPGTSGGQGNTSMASVLLTLAEAPQTEASPTPAPTQAPSQQAEKEQGSSPLPAVGDVLGQAGAGLGESRPPFTELPQDPDQQDHHLLAPAAQGCAGEAAAAPASQPPQEVNVEIIQSRHRKKLPKTAKMSLAKEVPEEQRVAEAGGEEGGLVVNVSFPCTTCHKSYQTLSRLERHQQTHQPHQYQCQVCDKSFAAKYNLKIHMLSHTQERPHVCTLCSKAFRYLRDLAEHKHLHEGSRPYECKACDASFLRSRDYTRHMREQHETQRHRCQVCGAVFKRRQYLDTVHMRTHNQEAVGLQEPQDTQRHRCQVCGAVFKRRQYLETVHMRTHNLEAGQVTEEAKGTSSVESHICSVCGKIFARARYLTAHLRMHSNRADYVRCSKCPRMFTSQQTLGVHETAFHSRSQNQGPEASSEDYNSQNVAAEATPEDHNNQYQASETTIDDHSNQYQAAKTTSDDHSSQNQPADPHVSYQDSDQHNSNPSKLPTIDHYSTTSQPPPMDNPSQPPKYQLYQVIIPK